MTPDAASLHAAARALDDEAGTIEAARTAVRADVLGTTWDCSAGARQRDTLADLDAAASTGHDELRAGATALRRLADAVEALQQAMTSAWSSTSRDLQAGLRHASADPKRAEQAADLRRSLASLPDARDPYWAARVSVPRVPMPALPACRSGGSLGPAGQPGVVRVDAGELRAMAGSIAAQGRLAASARARAASAAAGLPLHQLDAYGLPGSRTGGLLDDVTSSGSAAARAADGWADAASSARALADLVELAGEGDLGAVLEDPRAATALRVSALFGGGASSSAVSVLDGLSPGDASWVLAHVPAAAVDDEYRGLKPVPGVLTAADVLGGLVAGGVMGHNAAAMSGTASLLRSQAMRDVGRALATDPAHVTRSQWYGRVDDARLAAAKADALARRADDVRASSKSVPVKLGGGLAVAGIAYEIHSGKDPAQAAAAGGAGFLAAVGTGAAIGSFVPIPGVGTVAGAVIGAGFGIFTSGAVDSLFEEGPDVGAALDNGWEAVTDTGGAIKDGAGDLAGAVGGWFD